MDILFKPYAKDLPIHSWFARRVSEQEMRKIKVGSWRWPATQWHVVFPNFHRPLFCQWSFQKAQLEVPTIYKDI